MAIATLSIDIEARLAKLEQGMAQAVQISQASAEKIQNSFKGVGTFIGGLGIAAAVTGYINSLKAAVDTADRIDDLSEKYGIAADKLSVYSYASQVAGTSSEEFAVGLNKLSKTMAAAAGGGKEQIAVFDALGVKYKESNGQLRSVDDVLLDVADKFKSYEAGAGKAALAQELFGKSGAELIPLLDKGRDGISKLAEEAKGLGAAFGSELAKQAGDFNDNMKRIELASQGAKIALVGQFLPALNDSIVGLIRAKVEGRLAAEVFERLRDLFSGKEAIGFFFPTSATDKARKSLEDLQANIAITEQQVSVLEQRQKNGKGSQDTGDRLNNLSAKLTGLKADADKAKSALKTLEQSSIFGGGSGGSANPKIAAPVVAKGSVGIDKTAKAYEKLIGEIRERISLGEAELAGAEKLTDAQKFAIKIVTELGSAENGYSDAQKIRAGAELSRAIEISRLNAEQEKYIKTAEESLKLSLEETEALHKIGDARKDAVLALKDETEEYGLNAEQVTKLRTARLEEILSREQQKLAVIEGLELAGRETEELKRNIEQLALLIAARNELASKDLAFRTDAIDGADRAVTDYLKKVSEAGIETKRAVDGGIDTLTSNLTDSLASGKLDVSSFINYTLKEVLRLSVVGPFLKSLFSLGGGSADGSDFFSSFIKFFAADGKAFGASGPVPFAKGDIFNSPHLFKFASGGSMKTGMLGEAGPEAIMPLRRGADGRLGVASSGGGSNTQVTNNISIGAGITRGELYSSLQQYGAQLKGEILGSIRNGGTFAR